MALPDRSQPMSQHAARAPADGRAGEEEPSLAGLSERSPAAAICGSCSTTSQRLPDDQREALVLAELHDNSHAEVAEILGCDQEKVKSLVFQARTSLMKSREARELRARRSSSQLSVLRGGSLRRTVIRRHLAECEGCRLFSDEVKRQRAAMAICCRSCRRRR